MKVKADLTSTFLVLFVLLLFPLYGVEIYESYQTIPIQIATSFDIDDANEILVITSLNNSVSVYEKNQLTKAFSLKNQIDEGDIAESVDMTGDG